MRYPDLFARLLANSVESDDRFFEGTPCQCWTGTSLCRRKWYGRLNVWHAELGRTKTVQAHRLMAEIVIGRKLDPEFETLDHGCEWGPCINPWHLRIATRVENTANMQRKRHGKPRIEMRPLLPHELWDFDPLMWPSKPRLRSTLIEMEAPF